MLKNILNLEGVTVLGKKQLESVSGGQSCSYTVTTAGGNHVAFTSSSDYPEGPAGSDAANDVCVGLIGNGTVSRCFYNCEWDD